MAALDQRAAHSDGRALPQLARDGDMAAGLIRQAMHQPRALADVFNREEGFERAVEHG